MQYCTMDSPLGPLLLAGDEKGLQAIHFPKDSPSELEIASWEEKPESFKEARRQLEKYFAGKLQEFDLPLQMQGTPFQTQVWQELQKIPFGSTTTYGEVARRIGNPKSVRAVGAANGKNPIPIIVPCHRVIGKNGKLVGFSGGLNIKEQLLHLEEEFTNLSF